MDVDELYLTPPEKFVAARNALAKAHPEVKSLKRPTPSAWLLNVLAKKHHKTLAAVFAAGEQAQAAQDRVLAGEGAALMQDAMSDVRAAIARAVDVCRTILAENGRKEDDALLKKLSSILRTASVDAKLRAEIETGRLLADPGEEEDEESLVDQLVAAAPKPKAKTDDRKEREEKARLEREKKRAEAKKVAEEAKELEREARAAYVSAEDELDAARRVVEARETAFARASKSLEKATEARKAADAALAALD